MTDLNHRIIQLWYIGFILLPSLCLKISITKSSFGKDRAYMCNGIAITCYEGSLP